MLPPPTGKTLEEKQREKMRSLLKRHEGSKYSRSLWGDRLAFISLLCLEALAAFTTAYSRDLDKNVPKSALIAIVPVVLTVVLVQYQAHEYGVAEEKEKLKKQYEKEYGKYCVRPQSSIHPFPTSHDDPTLE